MLVMPEVLYPAVVAPAGLLAGTGCLMRGQVSLVHHVAGVVPGEDSN